MPDFTLKDVYDNAEAIPELFRGLYGPNADGKFVPKAPEDVSGLKTTLEKYKGQTREQDAKIKAFEQKLKGLSDEQLESVRRLPPEKLQKLIEMFGGEDSTSDPERLIEKRLNQLKEEYSPKMERLAFLEEENKNLIIDHAMRDAALAAGVDPAKLEDALMVSRGRFDVDEHRKIILKDKDGDPIKDGDPKKFFEGEFKKDKAWYYLPSGSRGGGSNGGGDRPGDTHGIDPNLPPDERLRRYREQQTAGGR